MLRAKSPAVLHSVRWVDISSHYDDMGLGLRARMSESAHERICPNTLPQRRQDTRIYGTLVLYRRAILKKNEIPIRFSSKDPAGNIVDLVARPVRDVDGEETMEFVLPGEIHA